MGAAAIAAVDAPKVQIAAAQVERNTDRRQWRRFMDILLIVIDGGRTE